MHRSTSMSSTRILLPSLALALVGCAGPTQMQERVAAISPTLESRSPEPDDETALAASQAKHPEPALLAPTTGHLQLGDHTARDRRIFGRAPRLMTPWDVALAEHDAPGFDLELVIRYADLEPSPGPGVSRHPLQHRSLVLGFRPRTTDRDASAPQ